MRIAWPYLESDVRFEIEFPDEMQIIAAKFVEVADGYSLIVLVPWPSTQKCELNYIGNSGERLNCPDPHPESVWCHLYDYGNQNWIEYHWCKK